MLLEGTAAPGSVLEPDPESWLEWRKEGYSTKQSGAVRGWAQTVVVEKGQGTYQKAKGKENNLREWNRSNHNERKKQQKGKGASLSLVAHRSRKKNVLPMCPIF